MREREAIANAVVTGAFMVACAIIFASACVAQCSKKQKVILMSETVAVNPHG